jgi:hypothetical protein
VQKAGTNQLSLVHVVPRPKRGDGKRLVFTEVRLRGVRQRVLVCRARARVATVGNTTDCEHNDRCEHSEDHDEDQQLDQCEAVVTPLATALTALFRERVVRNL